MATPILTTAEEEMVTLIDAMTSTSYNLDWGRTNEEDVCRIDWCKQTASAVIYWEGEENTDTEDGAHANAYANIAEYRIRVRCQLTEEPEFPMAAKRARLRLAVDDLKKLFGTNYWLNSSQLQIMYKRTGTPDVRQQGDIVLGEIDTFWTVRYYQDRQSPATVAQ